MSADICCIIIIVVGLQLHGHYGDELIPRRSGARCSASKKSYLKYIREVFVFFWQFE